MHLFQCLPHFPFMEELLRYFCHITKLQSYFLASIASMVWDAGVGECCTEMRWMEEWRHHFQINHFLLGDLFGWGLDLAAQEMSKVKRIVVPPDGRDGSKHREQHDTPQRDVVWFWERYALIGLWLLPWWVGRGGVVVIAATATKTVAHISS